MSASEICKFDNDDGTTETIVTGAGEVVTARNDEWARKTAYKQNHNFPKEKWNIDASFTLDELRELLDGKEKVIVPLGYSY